MRYNRIDILFVLVLFVFAKDNLYVSDKTGTAFLPVCIS